MNALSFFAHGDPLIRLVAFVLLGMSVGTWVIVLWKAALLHRATGDVVRAIGAFWQSDSFAAALERVKAFDREALISCSSSY